MRGLVRRHGWQGQAAAHHRPQHVTARGRADPCGMPPQATGVHLSCRWRQSFGLLATAAGRLLRLNNARPVSCRGGASIPAVSAICRGNAEFSSWRRASAGGRCMFQQQLIMPSCSMRGRNAAAAVAAGLHTCEQGRMEPCHSRLMDCARMLATACCQRGMASNGWLPHAASRLCTSEPSAAHPATPADYMRPCTRMRSILTVACRPRRVCRRALGCTPRRACRAIAPS